MLQAAVAFVEKYDPADPTPIQPGDAASAPRDPVAHP
jgi:hypothetical protein